MSCARLAVSRSPGGIHEFAPASNQARTSNPSPNRTGPHSVAVQVLRLVRAGGTFVPVSCLNSHFNEGILGAERSELFTGRQKQVIEAIRLGKPNKIIAYELSMCESTVKVHVRTIMSFRSHHPFLLPASRLVTVWEFADTLNGLMAAPSLIALTALAGVSRP